MNGDLGLGCGVAWVSGLTYQLHATHSRQLLENRLSSTSVLLVKGGCANCERKSFLFANVLQSVDLSPRLHILPLFVDFAQEATCDRVSCRVLCPADVQLTTVLAGLEWKCLVRMNAP